MGLERRDKLWNRVYWIFKSSQCKGFFNRYEGFDLLCSVQGWLL